MSDFESRSRLVAAKLRLEDKSWSTTPDYRTFDRARVLGKARQVYDAILAEGYENTTEIDEAFSKTNNFIENAFDMRESRRQITDPLDRAFIVPMRTIRTDESYASEVLPFVPLYDPRFGVNSDIRQRSLVGLPPLVLDTYSHSNQHERRGAIVLAPIFGDMKNDILTCQKGICRQIQKIKLSRLVTRNVNLTAKFAKDRLGVKALGLGAIIPSITNFGNDVKEKDLVTTTGHGGTVHLIVETVKQIFHETEFSEHAKIGVIGGAGSIGYSTVDVVTHAIDDFGVVTFDKNQYKLRALIDNHPEWKKIEIADSAIEVLEKSSVIVTAVTSRIDLDRQDPHHDLDLTGKFIVDDSQPGCFDREQIESRGGKLLWVVGEDGSNDKFMTRDKSYNFGDEAGIYGTSAIWGCEAEVGVIAASRQYNKALRHRVDPESARQIGALCTEYMVRVAPYQSYGRLVGI